MKFLVVLAVAVACAAADVSHVLKSPEYEYPIVRQSYDISPDGNSFKYSYETGQGINAEATGAVKNPNSENAALQIDGSYAYVSPEGIPIQVKYTAGEDGYTAYGDSIPVGPAIPEAIARSLEYIASRPVEKVYNAKP